MNPSKLLADSYASVLRLFGDDLSRADADRLLSMYSPWLRMHATSVDAADEVRALVLDRFPDEPEPELVADPDPWCEIVADSKLIVDQMLAEDLRVLPKRSPLAEKIADANVPAVPLRRLRDRQGDTWRVLRDGALLLENGEPCPLVLARGHVEHHWGPLVEVTDEPTAVA